MDELRRREWKGERVTVGPGADRRSRPPRRPARSVRTSAAQTIRFARAYADAARAGDLPALAHWAGAAREHGESGVGDSAPDLAHLANQLSYSRKIVRWNSIRREERIMPSSSVVVAGVPIGSSKPSSPHPPEPLPDVLEGEARCAPCRQGGTCGDRWTVLGFYDDETVQSFTALYCGPDPQMAVVLLPEMAIPLHAVPGHVKDGVDLFGR